MKDIAVYGCGSYGQELVCLIEKINSRILNRELNWKFIGFFDDNATMHGKEFACGKVLGGIDLLNSWQFPLAVVIAIANVTAVRNLVNHIKNPAIDFPNIIDPDTSFIDIKTFRTGHGNIIGEGCRFSPNVTIGDFNIIVNDSVFGHDVSVGSFNVFFPEVRLSGYVTVGDGNLFGIRTAVFPGFRVGSSVRVAAGSFLLNDALDGFLYQGNPARKLSI